MWLINQDRSMAMSVIPKCGTTSIQDAWDKDCEAIYQNKDVVDIPQRVTWIRNPIDRLISAYSFFYYMGQQGTTNDHVKAKNVASWEAFVDYALATKDVHWNPQVEMLTHEGIYLPTHLNRFEELSANWGKYRDGLVPWHRRVSHLPVFAYREADIHVRYAEDMALWLSLAQ